MMKPTGSQDKGRQLQAYPRNSRNSSLREMLFYCHFTVFFVFFGLWTWKLLESYPVPEEIRAELEAYELSYIAAKSLHLAGYAFLTVLAGTLPVPRFWRILFIALLVCHGVGTEIGQTYVENRHGCYQDVLIDWTGITIGMAFLYGLSILQARLREFDPRYQ